MQSTLKASSSPPQTGLTREAYRDTIRGIVRYFKHFQGPDGRIIDPFVRREVQYSTPCYAWAAAILLKDEKDPELLESAARALDSSLEQLATAKPADRHGDFFTFPALLAYEHLKERVTPERRERWERDLRALDPARAYNDVLTEKRMTVHNWNVVSLTGEFLRHRSGFTDLDFVERHLPVQIGHFTPEGLYRDPNVPMAYDHFPRHFLTAMLYQGYAGKHKEALEIILERGAWTSLLLQSPAGELPTGGRSAQHQWNEAEQCVTFEISAARKRREGDNRGAEAFKRAARLSFQALRRWIRPSGELWIVKNYFDPALRHGFEGYSFHSQYNLLAASMLATAWLYADDRIPEGVCPADTGGFVVELPEFHKIIANAGGLYLEIETGADPHYNSTGLIRIHKSGVDPLVGPSDSSPIDAGALAVGVGAWNGKGWDVLAGYGRKEVASTRVKVQHTQPNHVRFSVVYTVSSPVLSSVTETYDLTPERVRVTSEIAGSAERTQVRFPALVFDGKRVSAVEVNGNEARVRLGESIQTFRVEEPKGVVLRRSGRRIPCRNGFLEPIEGEARTSRWVYTLRPHREEEKPKGEQR
ncbi:MAG: hypothetical protein KY468_14990 [Armatimonadetes bacterium]|nr:hypothetical protein [Armatimonadota bacterium]